MALTGYTFELVYAHNSKVPTSYGLQLRASDRLGTLAFMVRVGNTWFSTFGQRTGRLKYPTGSFWRILKVEVAEEEGG